MGQPENFLQVAIDIQKQDEEQFRSLMNELMPSFTTPPTPHQANLTFGWELQLAMKREQGETTTITHLWRIDPANPWMVEVMGELGTLPAYGALDKLVQREEQNYMLCNERYYTEKPDASEWVKAAVIETLDVTSDPGRLRMFEGSLVNKTGLDFLAIHAKAEHGWTLLAEHTPVSGLLRRFVHYWAIEPNGTRDVEVFRNWLMQQKEYQAAVRSTSLVAATPFSYAAASGASGG